MRGAAFALAALAAAGCTSSDLCGHAGTCIGLDVDGDPVRLDALDLLITGGARDVRGGTSGLETMPPLTTALYLPADLIGDLTIHAVAKSRMIAVADGVSPPVHVEAGAHARARLTLHALTVGDGGPGDAASDLAVGDLAMADLASGDLARRDLAVGDLAMADLAARDLAAPDLVPPPPDGSPPDIALPSDLSKPNDLSAPYDLAGSDGPRFTCPMNALICEGFELGLGNNWINNPGVNGQSQFVNAANSGFNSVTSLYSASPMRAGGISISPKTPLNKIANGVLALRFYVRATNDLASGANYVALLKFDNGLYVTVGDNISKNVWRLFNQSGGEEYNSNLLMIANTWLCVEALLDFDMKKVSLYVTDGQQPNYNAAPLGVLPVVNLPPVDSFSIGLPVTPGTVNAAIFMDDVVVARQRIGCE